MALYVDVPLCTLVHAATRLPRYLSTAPARPCLRHPSLRHRTISPFLARSLGACTRLFELRAPYPVSGPAHPLPSIGTPSAQCLHPPQRRPTLTQRPLGASHAPRPPLAPSWRPARLSNGAGHALFTLLLPPCAVASRCTPTPRSNTFAPPRNRPARLSNDAARAFHARALLLNTCAPPSRMLVPTPSLSRTLAS
ncbi:hypothetical protein DENSPDRAFT_886277 [Dentipellis sp. KUC8613]|nr:hypothetical protein DENSPDRAFT_886277 [Dentipellis sp. KUC8613]